MAFEKNNIPKDLIERLKNGDCALFVGAGLSIPCGLPSWGGLLRELIDEVKKLPFETKEQVADYEKMIEDSNKYLTLASDLKEILGPKFFDYVKKRFTDGSLRPNQNHDLVVKLPFKFVITTNYDQLIDQTYAFTYRQLPAILTYSMSRDIAYKIWNNEYFILKAHGDININSEGIVMTENDYREIIYRNPGFQSALQVLFSTKSILFLGTSFSDIDFILLMRFLHTSYHGGGPTHYILVNETEVLNTEAKRYLHDFKLHTIKYNPENNREQITQFLELLIEEVSV